MEKYTNYETTETDWLSAIPDHWDFVKAKRLFHPVTRKGYPEEKLLSVTQDKGVVPREDLEDRVMMPLGEVNNYNLVEPGNFVISLRSFEGGIEISNHRGLVSPAYTVLKTGELVYEAYYRHLFKSRRFVDALYAISTGIRQGKTINYRDFGELYIPVPPLSEQRPIANYLDEKSADIDAYVARKRELVDLLETQRRAVVNRAVTKGLDDDVEMRHSGVEWLGEIPVHWEEIRLRYATSYVTSGSRGWGQYYDENGHALFVRIGNLRRGSINLDLSDTEYLTLPENVEGKRTRLQEGDVLLSITADIGSVGVVPDDLGEAYVNQHVALTRPRRDLVDPRWMGYALLSGMGRPQLRSQLYGGTKDGLSLADVKDVTLCVPPLEEQKRIVEHIDARTAYIDAAIEHTERQIDLMQQYRTSLVTEVVTGAVDVRAEVAA